jgi:hypothetical protein
VSNVASAKEALEVVGMDNWELISHRRAAACLGCSKGFEQGSSCVPSTGDRRASGSVSRVSNAASAIGPSGKNVRQNLREALVIISTVRREDASPVFWDPILSQRNARVTR